MPLESLFFLVLRAVIGKIQTCQSLQQAAPAGNKKDVGIFLCVPAGIRFRQLTLADAGDAVEEYLVVLLEKLVQGVQFLLTPGKPSARAGDACVIDQILDQRGQTCWRRYRLFVPLHKATGHHKQQNTRQESGTVRLAQLLSLLFRDLLILLQQVIQLLQRHCAVRHHGENVPLYGLAQLLLVRRLQIEAADLGTQLLLTLDPAAHLTGIKHKVCRLRA